MNRSRLVAVDAAGAFVVAVDGAAALPVGHTVKGEVSLSVTDPSPTATGRLVNGAFSQSIGANEPLRTGTYSKTLTFTLSTTRP